MSIKKNLIKQMSDDLHIYPYLNENDVEYYSRLIYSATTDWLKISIFDKTNEKFIETKSKNYLRIRGNEILEAFIKMFPECYDYFYSKGDTTDNHPINLIRESMIKAGELVETFEGITLPNGTIRSINSSFNRVLGIQNKKYLSSGITKLVSKSIDNNDSNLSIAQFTSEEVFNKILNNIKWEKYNDDYSVQVFNPFKKKSPYQCWEYTNFMIEKEIYISRIKVTDYLYSYFWIKKLNGNLFVSKVNEYLSEFEEIRRFILWQRKKYQNPVQAHYELKGKCVKVKLYAKIPFKEQIIMETYGWPIDNVQNRQGYVFPIEVWENIKAILKNLEFNVMEV